MSWCYISFLIPHPTIHTPTITKEADFTVQLSFSVYFFTSHSIILTSSFLFLFLLPILILTSHPHPRFPSSLLILILTSLHPIQQHIANTIWGMAKMDSSWDLIPGKNLESALIRAARHLTPQEVCTIPWCLERINACICYALLLSMIDLSCLFVTMSGGQWHMLFSALSALWVCFAFTHLPHLCYISQSHDNNFSMT